MQPIDVSNSCPCGSAKPYSDCCAVFHQGSKTAQTPEQLMRSRYSAYVLELNPYLLETWHTSTRPSRIRPDSQLKWLGLTIKNAHLSPSNPTTEGYVEFIARYKMLGEGGGAAQKMHETSRFVREDSMWYYIDGVHHD